MRTVRFNPATLQGAELDWWTKWSAKADTATRDVIADWEQWLAAWLHATPAERAAIKKFDADFKNTIWTDLKHWMYDNLFFKKCAYCETRATRFYPDAEHHRPKGSVLQPDAGGAYQEAGCLIPMTGDRIRHPGYFWLAYDWRNLIPSCKSCNSGDGKVDKYPVTAGHVLMMPLSQAEAAALIHPAIESTRWPGHYYLSPSDLDVLEEPLVLNPLNVDAAREPSRHLRFARFGVIAPRQNSVIGDRTIRVLNLDDGNLDTDRRREQESLQRNYYGKKSDPDHFAEAETIKSRYLDGQEQFSVAAAEWLHTLGW